MSKHPIATIEMSSGAKIIIELFPENAPNTCNSFIDLAKRGLYDNREIKRIVPGFVIQPSYSSFDKDPEMEYSIAGEFAASGFEGGLPNEYGSVAMGGDGVTASGSCFYFTMCEEERLKGNYPVFGKVIEGIDELRRIESVPLKPVEHERADVKVNIPVTPEIMVKVSVETFGVDYPPPVKLPPKEEE
ncbi:MAG: peptidylprolyl isomerase [Treponema sp.]|nr:peptidylprolyl isomerase [Treponema sp.]